MLVDLRDLQEVRIILGSAAESLRSDNVSNAEEAVGRADYLIYEIMGGRGRKIIPGGNCGWCHDHIDGDVFKHVQKCRYKFVERQAAQMRVAADALTKLAKDLEDK